MTRHDDFNWDDKPGRLQYAVVISVIVILLLVLLAGLYFFLVGRQEEEVYESNTVISENFHDMQDNSSELDRSSEAMSASEDPQSQENLDVSELGAEVEIAEILIAEGAAETAEQTIGIDVSKYQGNIDWQDVAASGIDFAMIRVGYRTMGSGQIVEDSSARYNLQEATANGIKVGAYFFSTAISEAEAIEEAKWTAEFISQYKITYPVAFNCEGFENSDSRQYQLTKEERTGIAKAFLNQIYECGYTPVFYASKNELMEDTKWITSELEKSYKIWISWYPDKPFPETPDADYTGLYDMWQYTNNAAIAGVDYPVDVNVAYFGYEGENAAQNSEAPEQVEANVEAGHHFTEVNETVTAKDATNLRNIPSQGEDSTVMLTLQNGQTATCTGTSTSGWSRVLYNGQTYYAVSSLLTTDLTAKPPETISTGDGSQSGNTASEPDDGIKTEFIACDEKVMPKIEVNLRTIPSVTDPDSIVVATAKYGEIFRRTGYNEDYGWSRVEYNGQTLYCVSSYIYVYELPEE